MQKVGDNSKIRAVNYSFLRKQGGEPVKIDLDWQKMKALFFKYGEIKTPTGNIGQYKYHHADTGVSYRVQGNLIVIVLCDSLIRNKINLFKKSKHNELSLGYTLDLIDSDIEGMDFEQINIKPVLYEHLENGLNYLFKVGVLKKPLNTTASNIIETRGKLTIRHSIGTPLFLTNNAKIDSTGKRYQRGNMTVLEIAATKKSLLLNQLKQHQLLPEFRTEIVRLHTLNMLSKLSMPLLSVIIASKLGKNRQNNTHKIKQWLTSCITI